MKKKDLFRIASMLVMILLLPFLQMEQIFRILICGIPLSLIIAYGYITRDKITSTLSGILLCPLSQFYFGTIYALADHYFTIEWLIRRLIGWLGWLGWIDTLSFIPLLICGLVGYFASRRTKVSLSIAIFFGILFIFIMLGID